ncbi:DUF4381 family protein [Lysobacter solisilvae (ex Woo and Kim 2020)]|uniref:DUF4381 family protein n=1 Tax=Agrilutibacter terrestris TaxID=2865112 RepID=A0A7H0FUR1_9GAMM|nr:DUF4381 family protein [Lysobacter terrestris]QNP39777.1 DUF4381 family protein [Lysobacter terrestris]
MNDPGLVLRDIHPSPAPSWWPPASGWWALAAVLVAVVVACVLWRRSRQRRIRRVTRMFDDALAVDAGASAQVAAMSQLLRRAARRRDRHADTLSGDAWLAFLDAGDARAPFSQGEGRLLLDGGFRRDTDLTRVAALQSLARARFVDWMVK